MDDLLDLYREIIVDHGKHPRNLGCLAEATHQAEGHNPLCGDCVTVYLRVNEGVIEEVRFEGTGCAISTASASLMTEELQGKTVAEGERIFEEFRQALIADGTADLGPLEALKGVKEYPMRVKCATLAWHTMQAALREAKAPVSTER